MNTITLTPAYDRDYTSMKKVKDAWNTNMDFMAHPFNGPSRYTSRQDLEQYMNGLHPYTHVEIRYDKSRKVMIIALNLPERK
jgi:hypothetical protein